MSRNIESSSHESSSCKCHCYHDWNDYESSSHESSSCNCHHKWEESSSHESSSHRWKKKHHCSCCGNCHHMLKRYWGY